jgi:GTP cyclohydrolase II
MLLPTLVALQLLVSVSVSPQPSPGGFIDAEFKRRQDSAADLTRELQKLQVPLSSQTELQLTVIASAEEPTQGLRADTTLQPEILGGGQHSTIRPVLAKVVRLRLQLKDYTKDFLGQDRDYWEWAARDAARQIQAWLKDNQARICQESPGSCD